MLVSELDDESDFTWREPPCDTVEEFVCSRHYMDARGRVWPAVLAELEAMNDGTRVEAVLTGAIGSAKTTAALYSQAYQLHRLLCYRDPHSIFGLDPTSEIVVILQSLRYKQAKEVAYDRFKALIDAAPWFRRPSTAYDKAVKSQLIFPRRIVVKPVAGNESAAIGQNVIGGLLDEVNFMETVENSRRTADKGTFDQVKALYAAIARRRESRFMVRGDLPGLLCLVSSKRFRGQFTDQKQEEARTNDKIYVYDKRLWEVAPPELGKFSGEMFEVFTGDEHRKPFVLGKGHEAPDGARDQGLVMEVPVEFRPQFDSDLLGALRDIGGVSTTAMHPFILDPERVVGCFGRHPSIFSRQECDFDSMRLQILEGAIVNPEEPRLVHVDLAVSRDSCGVAIGHVAGFRRVPRGLSLSDDGDEAHEHSETLPVVRVDGIVEVRPPSGGEIVFERIRNIVYVLARLGVNVRWVTFDSFQSTDSRQILSRKGYRTGLFSLDKDVQGYDIAKQAFYDGRVSLPAHEKCLREFLRLERDEKKGKVDHRPGESKDCSDAVAGVIAGLTRKRLVWARWGVALSDVPRGIRNQVEAGGVEEGEGEPMSGRTRGFKKRREKSLRLDRARGRRSG